MTMRHRTAILLLWSSNLWVWQSAAFTTLRSNNAQTTRLTFKKASLAPDPSSSAVDEKEEMRKSIEAMRQEARKRLEALSKEVSEYQASGHGPHADPSGRQPDDERIVKKSEAAAPTPAAATTTKSVKVSSNADSMDSMEGDLTKIPFEDLGKSTNDKLVTTNKEKKHVKVVSLADRPVQVQHAEVDRLNDTRWKVSFDIGREAGTWMPTSWGASGDRLRFSVVVDLTSQPYHDKEEFFDGVAGAKILNVVEANLGPCYFENQGGFHGQQQLSVAPTGAYKVLRGSGPMGTDTLRFFIETEQEIVKSAISDVVCPKGRIYGNCGYFPVYSTLSPSPSSTKDQQHKHIKDVLQEEYNTVASRYEVLQKELDEDTRIFSMDHFMRMKEIMGARSTLKRLDQRILEARQREPERSQLRLSRRGDVGLSKEGGVCLKVQKGLAVEYHILGRMEVASVKELPSDHEDYDDLVHKLHP